MQDISSDSLANRTAQFAYLAEDRELLDLIWRISTLPEDARLIVQLMVRHLAAVPQSTPSAARVSQSNRAA